MSTEGSYPLEFRVLLSTGQIGKLTQLCLAPDIMGNTAVEFQQKQHPGYPDLVAFEVHFTTRHKNCVRIQPAMPEPSWFMTNYKNGPARYRFATVLGVCTSREGHTETFGLLMRAKVRPIAEYAHLMDVDEYLDTELRRIG